MQGPTHTLISFAFILFFLNNVEAFLIIPLKAPFQPAWTQQMYLFVLSDNRTGAQSAVRIPIATFLRSVNMPSAYPIFILFFDGIFLRVIILLPCCW